MNTDTDSTSSDSNDENGEFTINVKKNPRPVTVGLLRKV